MIQFKNPFQGAMFMFNMGFRLFPCRPYSKKPSVKDWETWAKNATQKNLEDYNTANAGCNWAVACGPSNLTVIDIDVKPDKNGRETLKNLPFKLPKTLTVRTPSGGQHLFYIGQGPTTVNGLGLGLDSRGNGGYVVALGSRAEGGHAYELEENIDATPIPDYVLSELKRNKVPTVINEGELVPEGERDSTITSLAGTMRARGMNAESMLSGLLAFNQTQTEVPLPEDQIHKIVNSVARYAPEHAKAGSDFTDLSSDGFTSKNGNEIEEIKIPRRQWIMQNRYIRGFVSVVVAPGGLGKSTLVTLDAVAIATGQPLTGFDIKEPCKVWLYNTEDPVEELERKLAAIKRHHGIASIENIEFTSGQDQPLILVKQDQNGVTINKTAIDHAVSFINTNNIGLFILDPFVRTHEVNENDNMQIDKVIWALQRIIKRTNCAIGVVHHTRKLGLNGQAGNAETARGASSLTNAARVSHTLTVMSEQEARSFHILPTNRRWYLRLDNAKANLQPPADHALWFQKKSVQLANGDAVGTLQHAELVKEIQANKEVEFEYERADLGRALSERMDLHQRADFQQIIESVVNDPRFTHLFSYSRYKDKRTLLRYIRPLMEEPIVLNGKTFSLSAQRGRGARGWILCKPSDEEETRKEIEESEFLM